MQCVILKIGIAVASKMTLATGHKNPNTYMVTGYELAQRMGKPEYMSVSSLGRYLNQDSAKCKFWLDKIHQGLVLPNIMAEERKESASHGRYSYFSNFCEGEILKLETDIHKMTQNVIVFSIGRHHVICIIRLECIIVIHIDNKDLSVCKENLNKKLVHKIGNFCLFVEEMQHLASDFGNILERNGLPEVNVKEGETMMGIISSFQRHYMWTPTKLT